MKRDNINYLLVGTVVLIGMAMMLYALYRLTGGVGENDRYFADYQNVGGLDEGTPVTYEGFKVGSVATIEPFQEQQGTRYRVTLLVRDGWRIPRDSIARIYSEGLLAETVINIEEGKSRDFLTPGEEIAGQQSMDLFKVINSVANDTSHLITGSVKPLLDNLANRVSGVGDQIDTRLPQILADISGLIATLQQGADRVPKILDQNFQDKVSRTVDNSEALTANLLQLSQGLDQTREAFDSLLKQSESAIKRADVLLGDTRGTVADNREDLRQSVTALKHSLQVVSDYTETILHNLETAARHMNEFSRSIRDNPGLLLGGKPPREVSPRGE